jgi:hypothetical protein
MIRYQVYQLQGEQTSKQLMINEQKWLTTSNFVRPQDGALSPKHVGDAPLIFVSIKAVCLHGVINEVLRDRKKFTKRMTLNFITGFTSALHLSLSWASSIQSIPHPTSSRSILILSFHLRQAFLSGLFPSGLLTKTLYVPLLSPIRTKRSAQLIRLLTHPKEMTPSYSKRPDGIPGWYNGWRSANGKGSKVKI